MSYSWTTITPTVPSGYTFVTLIGVDTTDILYAYFTGPLIPPDNVYNYGCVGRSADGGQTWTNMFYSDTLSNVMMQKVVDTGSVVWLLPQSTSYTPHYLYYTTDHGLTWKTCTNGGSRSWETIAVAGGCIYGVSNTYSGSIIRITESQICSVMGYSSSDHVYDSVCTDSQGNVFGFYDTYAIYKFTQAGIPTIYTTLTGLGSPRQVSNIVYVGGRWLAFDSAAKAVLASPDADVDDWTVQSSLVGVNAMSSTCISPGGALYFLNYDSNTGYSKIQYIPSDLSAVVDAGLPAITAFHKYLAIDSNNNIYATTSTGILKGTYTATKTLYVYHGSWKPVQAAYTSSGGVWKQASSISGTLSGKWK